MSDARSQKYTRVSKGLRKYVNTDRVVEELRLNRRMHPTMRRLAVRVMMPVAVHHATKPTNICVDQQEITQTTQR